MKNPLSAKGREGARRTPFLVRDGPPGARVRGHPQGVPLRVLKGGAWVWYYLATGGGCAQVGVRGVGSAFAAAEAGVEDVAEPVAEEVGAEDDEHDGEGGEDAGVPGGGDGVAGRRRPFCPRWG